MDFIFDWLNDLIIFINFWVYFLLKFVLRLEIVLNLFSFRGFFWVILKRVVLFNMIICFLVLLKCESLSLVFKLFSCFNSLFLCIMIFIYLLLF